MNVGLTAWDHEWMMQRYRIPVTQKVLDADDYRAMIEAVLEGHLTHGKHAEEFERALAKQFGLREAVFCNSGSSANLLALASLMQQELGEERLHPRDKVVTCAVGFPTTVNPIVQLDLTPIFIDCELGTYTPIISQLHEAIERSAKAAILSHTLGNPCDFNRMSRGKEKRFLIEDCCDALGSTYQPSGDWKPGERSIHVGNWSHLATCSFYPAHHITTGEGGAVLTNSPQLASVVESLRDWGRACYCSTGKDNTCGKRFRWGPEEVGDLPNGYDHKHVFARIGWNLKGTDIAAALGVSQLKKLPEFSKKRKYNFWRLFAALEDLQDRVILPKATPGSDPCWFGFPITLNPPLERCRVVEYLESKGVATRPIFAGNLVRQPAYRGVKYEVVGDLTNADRVMRDSFYVGVHPGLTEEHVEYEAKVLREVLTR